MKRPNILVILSDQLRRDALGVYGDPNISTPHIDRLANAGVRFTQACSTYPICVPFRFTFMTGEYAHSRSVPGIEWRMSPAEYTLADAFNAADYETIYVGKWHLYGGSAVLPGTNARKADLTPVPRTHQGRWQKWFGFELANRPFDTYYFEDDDPTPRPLGKYQTDGLFDLAMDYISGRENPERPFCCVVSVEPPHFPMEAPPELEAKWLATDLELPPNFMVQDKYPVPVPLMAPEQRDEAIRHRQIYYAMIENLDQNVGRLWAYLAARGLSDDTVIVFVSDHGDMGGAHHCRYRDKYHPYEEAVGIPLLIYDPRATEGHGRVVAEPVAAEDLFPTLLGLAGLTPPTPKPGMDASPLVRGEAERLDREGVLLEFVHDLRPGYIYHEQYWRAFRSRQYLYSVLGDATEGGKPWQLFDVARDPYEMINLIDDPAYAEVAREHHRLLRDRLIETEDHYVLAPAYDMEGLHLWA